MRTVTCSLALPTEQDVCSRAMSSVLLQGGRVIDPANDRDETADVLLCDGKIEAVGLGLETPLDVHSTDCKGKVVCPGLIDLHVHFREPGQTAKENMATGSAAAAMGGFTSVVCMPNTLPAIDTPSTVKLIQDKVRREAKVNVYIAGAITAGIAGEELAPIGSLKDAGVVAITDDGHCVQNNELMRRALEYAGMFDLPVMDHCQDYSMVTDGVMHEGYWSTNLGLKGWPASGENLIVARNIELAELTGTHVHCQHVSSAKSVELIRRAKANGISISGEACPHHFTLTDAALGGSEHFWAEDGKGLQQESQRTQWPSFDTHFKMNPPLRSAEDRTAVIEGLADGTLEILASDHAPHCAHEKDVEFDYAPFGITGLETELALSLTQLYHTQHLALSDLISKYTINPATLLNLPKGTLTEGTDADVTVFDPDAEWVFDVNLSPSKSSNTPFNGWTLKGRPACTIINGKIVWQTDQMIA
jgi:dihydroorotase